MITWTKIAEARLQEAHQCLSCKFPKADFLAAWEDYHAIVIELQWGHFADLEEGRGFSNTILKTGGAPGWRWLQLEGLGMELEFSGEAVKLSGKPGCPADSWAKLYGLKSENA